MSSEATKPCCLVDGEPVAMGGLIRMALLHAKPDESGLVTTSWAARVLRELGHSVEPYHAGTEVSDD